MLTERPVFLSGLGQGGSLAMDVAYSTRSELSTPVEGVAVFAGYYISHGQHWRRALDTTRLLWVHSQRNKKVPFAGAKYGFERQMKKENGLVHGELLPYESPDAQR